MDHLSTSIARRVAVLTALTLLCQPRATPGYPEPKSAVHRANMIQLMMRKQRQVCPAAQFCNPRTDSHYVPLPCCKHCNHECEGCERTRGGPSHSCCPDRLPTHYADIVDQRRDVARTCTRISRFSSNGTYMFSHCPEGTEGGLDHNCTTTEMKRNLSELVPVTDRDTGDVYKNVYCAICNDVRPDGVEPWRSRVQCTGDDFNFTSIEAAMDDLLKEDPVYCDLSFEPASEPPPGRPPIIGCTINPESKRCNRTRLWKDYDEFTDYACHFYYSPVEMSRENMNFWFPNIFCAFCNGIEDLSEMDAIKCDAGNVLSDFTGTGGVRYSILLDTDTITTDIDTSQQCQRNHVYDTKLGECIPTHCSVLRRLEGETCQRWLEDISVFTYVAIFRFVPGFPLRLDTAYRLVPDIVADIGTNLLIYNLDRQCMYKTSLATSGDIEASENSTITFIDLKMECVIMEDHDPELIYKAALDRQFFRRSLFGNAEYPFVMHICSSSADLFPNVILLNDTLYRSLVHEKRLLNETMNQAKLTLGLEQSRYDQILNVVTIPYFVDSLHNEVEYGGFHGTDLLSLAPCPVRALTREVFPWQETLTGLRFVKTGVRLETWEYVFEDQDRSIILVCVDSYRRLVASTASDGKTKMAIAGLMNLTLFVALAQKM